MSKLNVQVLEGPANKLNLAKLEDVLKRKLIIPSYQRPYAWQTEDIEEIFQTVKDTQESNETICFFGSIILSKKENGQFGQEEYYIIDGQQRLSSFLLILRVILDDLKYLFNKLADKQKLSEKEIEKKLSLKSQKTNLLNIINIVSLKRDQPSGDNNDGDSKEQSIIDFIKKSGDYDNLPSHLDEKINAIYDHSPIQYENDLQDLKNTEDFNKYIDDILNFLHLVLNQIKFCLICITGENSENFAINLFNTLNTTGQPLTAFEVLRSELYRIDRELSEKINGIQSEIIKKYVFQRKKVVAHTGKLLLYLPLYRGDFREGAYTLSDKKFKDQRGYLTSVLNDETAQSIVEDIEIINDFYSKYWLNPNSFDTLLKQDDERVCFQFLSELNHDRVLPILIRFYKNKRESLGKCVKICTAFSSLWRAFYDGGTAGVDRAYKTLSSNLKTNEIDDLNKELKRLFLEKLSTKEATKGIEEIKSEWLQKLKTSSVYKNQKLCKFLLFTAYNQAFFDSAANQLKKGKGVDIFNIHFWKHEDYKTIEHIIPKSDKKIIGHVHTLGNLTLLPQALNSALGDKPFSDKLKQYKNFCSSENEDKYPYLPVIKHIAACNQFEKNEIEQRSKILSEFVWKTLAEDWLGWE